ncbi:MAG: hypothetical protein MMC33_001569 [Icmadophila ericetorum]|nr:hypothetical protein [Icmadophila ericetorum]
MAVPSDDILTKTSIDTAKEFVEQFHRALSQARQTIASFYSLPAVMPNGKQLPSILFNGNQLSDAGSFQTMFQEQMPNMHYETTSLDCQVINPNYVAEGTASARNSKGQNATFLVNVSGTVKMGEAKETPKIFNETLVLIPNPLAHIGSRTRTRHPREWLIQSQNFRLVV